MLKKFKGLGDIIEKFTKITGIKKIIKKIKLECGCDERQNKLNKLFPNKYFKRLKKK